MSNKPTLLFFVALLLSGSCHSQADGMEKGWFPSKFMHETIVCAQGNKQVEQATLADLYASHWVDQPDHPGLQGLQWGAIVKNKPAKFPRSALGSDKTNTLSVSVLISEKGEIVDAYVICSTDPAFNDAALTATKKSRYRPVYIDGKPRLTVLNRPYVFSPDR